MKSAMGNQAVRRLAAASCSALAASAHAAHGELAGLGNGRMAAFGDGIIHVTAWSAPLVAALAVGLWCMAYPWRRAWLLPVAYAAAVAGGAYQGAGAPLTPALGTLVVATVVLLGMLVYGSRILPMIVALAIVVAFGAVHGYAHGAQAGAVPFRDYVIGATVATLGLSVAGMALGVMLRIASRFGMRIAGAAIAAAGLWFAFGAH
jgi:urease accessory protein